MATPNNGNGNLVDEFEEAFQSCLNVLTKQGDTPNFDKEENCHEVDNLIQRLIDFGRQMEAFFLQKRFLLSALKPELVMKEDNNDLRVELARKDDVIKRHYEKIAVWQNLLADLQGWSKSPAQGANPAPNGTPVAGSSMTAVAQSPSAQIGVSGMQSPMQAQMQAQQMQQAQMQQHQQHMQQMQQQQQQLQMQQVQHMQQMQGGTGVAGSMVGPQQALFMQQGSRGGFSQGPGGVLQGPLAYLEKTASNIDLVGMGEGRR